jgi:penicillin-binding protein 1A
LSQATWFSVNTVYAQVILDPRVTVQKTAQTAKDLGITNAWYSPQAHGASYALGALDVSPLDMASAYGVFDSHGIRVAPTPIIRVENPNGKTLIDDTAPNTTGNLPQCKGGDVAPCRALSAAVADNVTDVLTGVLTQPGATAYGKSIGRPAAGKTGTTSSYVDAWFVGYTPTLSTSVWMGRKNTEDPTKGASLYGIDGVGIVFGGTLPAATWQNYMTQAMAKVPVTNFNQPAPLSPVTNALDTRLRGGISPGRQQYPVVVGGGGPYAYGPAAPVATAPTTTTLPRESTTTLPVFPFPTTSTTRPGGLLGVQPRGGSP